MKNLIKILALSSCVTFCLCDDLKEKEAKINELEAKLKKEVSDYNDLIKQKQTGQKPTVAAKSEEPKKADDPKKEDSNKSAPLKSESKEAQKPLNISTDPHILQEQVKQLQDTVEKLLKEVKDLKESGPSKKKSASEEATKKVAETDTHIIEFTPAQAQFNAAVAWFEKGSDEDLHKAIESFEQIATEYCNQPIAFNAYIKIGDSYRKLAKWDLAIKNYDYVLDRENESVSQQADAYLGKAEAQRQKNDRVSACQTLDQLERSNIPLSKRQNITYQDLIVACDCASKRDKDVKEAKQENG